MRAEQVRGGGGGGIEKLYASIVNSLSGFVSFGAFFRPNAKTELGVWLTRLLDEVIRVGLCWRRRRRRYLNSNHTQANPVPAEVASNSRRANRTEH